MEIPKFEIPTPTKEKAPETEAGPHFELEEKKTKWEKFKAAEEKEPKIPPSSTAVLSTQFRPLTEEEIEREIEKILSENLDEIYQGLPANLKEQFKKRGDETVSEIKKIIYKTKIVIRKIFNLIKNWLKIVPGINKFFIEQEAKIKTAKILALAEKTKRKRL